MVSIEIVLLYYYCYTCRHTSEQTCGIGEVCTRWYKFYVFKLLKAKLINIATQANKDKQSCMVYI